MNEKITTEMMSRRKALSLLGLGAVLGFTLSSALEPLEAEAQEAAPAATTGTHGMQRRQGRRTHRHQRRHTRRTGQPARRGSSGAIAVRPLSTAGLRGSMNSELRMRSAG